MLGILLPEQVSYRWDVLKPAIEAALPPIVGDASERMNEVLLSILNGEKQCWLSYHQGDKVVPNGVVVTTILDNEGGAKDLLIYAAYAFKKLDEEVWTEGFEGLKKFAKSNGCNRITAYSSVDRIMEMAVMVGGDVSVRFITMPI